MVSLVIEFHLIPSRKVLDVNSLSESERVEREALRKAEAKANRPAVTDPTLKPIQSSSWWNLGLWSKGPDASENATKSAERNTNE